MTSNRRANYPEETILAAWLAHDLQTSSETTKYAPHGYCQRLIPERETNADEVNFLT
eukprot:CAMPEP_0183322876 /NCGR_PEP_ID=MMETSP0160_2-20130417/72905_1 /TAXON_ID=2839 ORGANISM="Odontella Sinensis, Strain Grunow 1884" /NCGR_SAMPLE_ID=MMETSP0160_2 /ASSEMBLY_ACC=CAM_ASM_000250 /LENGTH=56 /DNA_ID=CAMNT_0025490135 /DNA_START=265 /DNA_END=435 /DNA_ORIENTATION=+